jgi:hypothetical protein
VLTIIPVVGIPPTLIASMYGMNFKGIDLLINADRRNDSETRELFALDVMPHFT